MLIGAALAFSTGRGAAAAPATALHGGKPGIGDNVDALCARMFAAVADARIEFDRSSSVIRSSSYAALYRIVSFARDCPRGIIRISVHTDGTGEREYNMQLSRQRAAAIAGFLQSAGVPAARLATVGKGSAEPIADNATRRGRARNRRVEFELLESGF